MFSSIYDDEPIGMCFHLIIHNLTRASFAAYAVYRQYSFSYFLFVSSHIHSPTLFNAFSIICVESSPEMNIPMDFASCRCCCLSFVSNQRKFWVCRLHNIFLSISILFYEEHIACMWVCYRLAVDYSFCSFVYGIK